MDRFTHDAVDALRSYEAMEVRRRSLPAKRFDPAPRAPYAGTWAPKMTEAERKEHEQHVEDENLPF